MSTRTVTAALAAALLTAPAALRAQGVDEPVADSWRATRAWTDALEQRYSRFVQRVGRAVASGRCRHLDGCLNDPAVNPLHEAGAAPLRFRADCADVPYILRAYFAYRMALPFAWTRAMTGRGRDVRYLRDARASGVRLWTEFATPRELFERIGNEVHSGYFRLAPGLDEGDTYQTAVTRGAIRPGTMFYDPNGHVLVVYEVTAAGEVRFFDGHPDNSLTHPSLSARQVLGTAPFGGGFRNWRPFAVRGASVTFTPNRRLRHWGASGQFDRARHQVAGAAVDFHEWVRARLATRPPAAAQGT